MNQTPSSPSAVETTFKKRFSWKNASVLILSPPLAIICAVLYVAQNGFALSDFAIFLAMYVLTGLSMTAGYHRYFSHRAYECHPIIQFLFLFFGAAALENSVLPWSSDHRYHHRHVDTGADPYNINKGFFWAHMGWIFLEDYPGTRPYSNVADLKKSRLVMWQDRYYLPLAIFAGFALPFLLGMLAGRPWGGFIWGGLVRVVFVHHVIFLVNSAAHVFGKRPYSKMVTARDSWWLAFLTYGEGYHNYHHTFPSDYRNGIAWYHFDPTKWMIATLRRLGLASGLRQTSPQAIQRALDKENDRMASAASEAALASDAAIALKGQPSFLQKRMTIEPRETAAPAASHP